MNKVIAGLVKAGIPFTHKNGEIVIKADAENPTIEEAKAWVKKYFGHPENQVKVLAPDKHGGLLISIAMAFDYEFRNRQKYSKTVSESEKRNDIGIYLIWPKKKADIHIDRYYGNSESETVNENFTFQNLDDALWKKIGESIKRLQKKLQTIDNQAFRNQHSL